MVYCAHTRWLYDTANNIGFGLEDRSIRCLTCERMASQAANQEKANKAGALKKKKAASPKASPKAKAAKAGKAKAAKAGSTKPKGKAKATKAANVTVANKAATPEPKAAKVAQAKESRKSK